MSKRSPDDHFRDQGVRGVGETETHAEIHVKSEQFEVHATPKRACCCWLAGRMAYTRVRLANATELLARAT